MLRINDRQPDDVYLIGFPKSGHTWCQYLLAGLTCGIDTARSQDALVQAIVPDLEFRSHYERFTSPVFFKTHQLPRADLRRVVYLVRDGRDALVSLMHYQRAMGLHPDWPTLIESPTGVAAPWHRHVAAWRSNPHRADILWVRYEDLLTDAERELTRIADFAGLTASAEAVAEAVDRARFDRQQQREAERGWVTPEWPKDHRFVRRGIAGSFRDEMPAEAQSRFLEVAGVVLDELRYER
jgi:hypothetical protein